MIELGGNISLEGFADRDYAELIVVKKIVGRYARQLSDTHAGFESLKLVLECADPGRNVITAETVINGKHFSGSAEAPNLFVALDTALKAVVEEAKKS